MTARRTALGGGIVAGALHALSFALPLGWALAWVALTPLLYVAGRVRGGALMAGAFAYTSMVLLLDVAPWFLPTVARYFPLGSTSAWIVGGIAVALTAVLYGLLLGGALVLRRRSGGALGVVWCAALWSVWEALRTASIPPFFPLSILGTSQVAAPAVLQIASLTGIAGVTALVVAGNAAIAQLWCTHETRRRRARILGATALVVLAAASWGAARLARGLPPSSDGPVVLLVDGAATHVAESTIERYASATALAPGADPTVVVWPESTLTVDPASDARTWERLRALVDAWNAPLLTGGVGSAIADDGRIVRFNSVHFIRAQHGMKSYHKRRLVPFAESWPTWLARPLPGLEPVAAGERASVFAVGSRRLGPLICFEITSAAAARALDRLGAEAIINVNNDTWFPPGRAPHAPWARVRAVEFGLPVARAANGGWSAIIDPLGVVTASIRTTNAPTTLRGAIPARVATLYGATGDVFLALCTIVVVAGLVPWRTRLTARPDTATSDCRA